MSRAPQTDVGRDGTPSAFIRRRHASEQRSTFMHDSRTPPWWMFPDRLLILVILPLGIIICAVTRRLIETNRVAYTAPIFIDSFYTLLTLSSLVLLAAAACIGRQGHATGRDIRLRHGCLDFLFVICFAAYCIWYGPLFVMSPDLLIGALSADVGAVYQIREAAPNIPGVTTATQFGISYVCIYATARFVHGEVPHRRHDIYLAVILAMAAFRAVTNSERLAVIELLFPFLVILCKSDRLTHSSATRFFRQTLPLLMLFGSPVFFAIFEYNRSWINHYQFEYDSYWEFVFDRWAFYYITALNNICGFLEHSSWPTFQGEWTLQWLYRLPLLGAAVSDEAAIDVVVRFNAFLKEYASEQFNNNTGLLVVYYDWGILGGAIFLAIYGMICGLAFRAFREGRGILQYAFPIVLYSLIEILRIGYLYEGRSVAALIGLAIAIGGWGKKPHPTRQGVRYS